MKEFFIKEKRNFQIGSEIAGHKNDKRLYDLCQKREKLIFLLRQEMRKVPETKVNVLQICLL